MYLDLVLLAQLGDTSFDDRIDNLSSMAILPLGKIKVVTTVQWNWIAVEKIRHECEEAVGSELVGDELSVVELMPEDVGETGSHRNVREQNGTKLWSENSENAGSIQKKREDTYINTA